VRTAKLAVLFACLLGIPAGIGAFTFVYAKGFSYLSPDPRACVNCHVMNPQYDGWLKSGHRHTATCVECHLPHTGIAKWAAKAELVPALARLYPSELQGADRDHAA
jgi:cytochrome c nitrite reductase small subunit